MEQKRNFDINITVQAELAVFEFFSEICLSFECYEFEFCFRARVLIKMSRKKPEFAPEKLDRPTIDLLKKLLFFSTGQPL